MARRVLVYRNLTRGDWTIAAYRSAHSRGPVLWHRDHVVLKDVSFVVLENRRQAIIAALPAKKRKVMAWCVGTLVDDVPNGLAPTAITFNPYHCGSFVTRADGTAIASAQYVAFDAHAVAFGMVC